ncbi:MAG TPA: VWA domain-containing protein [Bacteroidales bacterium]|nr:VWA domain-containing protein [Bacteroidales bacterium]
MFRFENEFYLYGLLIIPILILGYLLLIRKDKKKWLNYGDHPLIQKLMPERSSTMQHLKFGVLMGALCCFILALANPQIGSSLEKGKKKGVDVMICMDISNSMLCQDLQPNRLEASKMAISKYIDQQEGNRIGLVIFAGKSFVQLPITNDYAAAKMFVNFVKPEMINTQGTDIASAIDLAAVSMIPEDKEGKPDVSKISKLNSKVIVVVSDGEDHFQDAMDIAKKVKDMGIIIHTIGIGSTQGVPIPTSDRIGTTTYKKDMEGNTVISRLNEDILKNIAQAGGGSYVHASNTSMGFEAIADKINAMEKSDLKEIEFSKYDSKFQIPLLIGIILLVIEALLFSVKPKWKKMISQFQQLFVMKKSVILLFLLFSVPFLQAQTLDEISALRKGNKEYAEAEKIREEAMNLTQKGGQVNERIAQDKFKKASQLYQKAEISFRKAMAVTKNHINAQYNLANTLYRQEKYTEAAEIYKAISENQKADKKMRSKAYHNYGNSLLKQEKYKESIDAYKKSLKINPKDKETKYNLEYAKKKMQQQQQQQQNKDQQNKQQQQQQQQQNKDQQNKQQQQQQQQQNKDQQNKKDQQQQQQQQQQDNKNKDQKQKSAEEKERAKEDKRQLDALQQNEKNTQQKVQRQQEKGRNLKQAKDW